MSIHAGYSHTGWHSEGRSRFCPKHPHHHSHHPLCASPKTVTATQHPPPNGRSPCASAKTCTYIKPGDLSIHWQLRLGLQDSRHLQSQPAPSAVLQRTSASCLAGTTAQMLQLQHHQHQRPLHHHLTQLWLKASAVQQHIAVVAAAGGPAQPPSPCCPLSLLLPLLALAPQPQRLKQLVQLCCCTLPGRRHTTQH